MAGLGDYDLESLMAGLDDMNMDSLVEMMNEQMKMLKDPEKLADAMAGVLSSLQSEEFVDAMVGQKDSVLDQLTSSGLLTPEQIEQYRNDPSKFGEDMKESFSQMQELFTDPDLITKLSQMMGFYKDLDLASLFTDDEDKAEETRLALLNPSNPLHAMFADAEETREILHDPVKWKAALKEGLDTLKENLDTLKNIPGVGDVPKKKGGAVLAGDEL